ncbi:hypothetical protein ACI3L1_09745 [Deinococcus sp. SM5_A1]|uniref:hypothetical protein n=1 Tax=Deinococcus sp. SM5_A1 TaxID=3379094 RepID=UPI00385E8BEE
MSFLMMPRVLHWSVLAGAGCEWPGLYWWSDSPVVSDAKGEAGVIPEDRFGFPFPAWVGYAFALAAALCSVILLFQSSHWPGWVGGVAGLPTAFLGPLAWRRALHPLDGPTTLFGFSYGFWALLSLHLITLANALETRLNVGPLELDDLIFPAFSTLMLCGFVWYTVMQNRRH